MGYTVKCACAFLQSKKYKKDVAPGQVWKCHNVNDSYINLTKQTLVYFELQNRKVIPLVYLYIGSLTGRNLTRGVPVLFEVKRHIVFQHVSDGCFVFGTRNCFIFLVQKEMFLLDFMRKNDESPYSFT